MSLATCFAALLLPFAHLQDADRLFWIACNGCGKGFHASDTKKPFVPWGFNYDHDHKGDLIEDYWERDWARVEQDFKEMRQLGANVVRIHLQLCKFMLSPDKPNPSALKMLDRLVRLAEAERLYLNLTGLGCYHKKDVPAWFDLLSERERWQTQALFWTAVAKQCAASPAVFCYDLMNEPVVPGGRRKPGDWLGPAFGGKHFVQFITLDQAKRPRHEIAREWIDSLVAAIRKHDRRHLITVGMVDWSLDRPGLTSGFVPGQVADKLDFISVHIYPERAKVDAALQTLAGFDVGKPIVIEEIFPLKCSTQELEEFIDKSKAHASGWFGFYWGRTPAELRPPRDLRDAILLGWLDFFERKSRTMK